MSQLLTRTTVLVDPETCEFYLSCKSCADTRRKELERIGLFEAKLSPIVPFQFDFLTDAIIWCKRLCWTSSLVPRKCGTNKCEHVPRAAVAQHPEVFMYTRLMSLRRRITRA